MPSLCFRRVALIPLLALLTFVCLAASAGAAATLNVPSQYATIQAGINAAQVGDTVLVADGTYTGPGNVDLDFGGRNIIVQSVHGAASTVIDCQGSANSPHRGFYLHRGESAAAKIDGFTVQNGYAPADSNGINYGGGIFTSGATVANCTFSSCRAASGGGGIYANGGTMVNCIVSGNSAFVSGYGGSGGGIVALRATIANCTISGNGGFSGGGISADGSTIVNCTVSGNTASFYGRGCGIYTSGGSTIINCTVFGNSRTSSSGDGIYAYDGTITNCICWNDKASQGSEIVGYAMVTYSDVQGGDNGMGNINADPLFVNSAAGDFHLQSGSPCRGAGTASGAPATDKDGTTRPNPPSMGAYEPAAPTHTWTATSICVGPDNLTHLLWNNVSGQASLWTVDANGTPSGWQFGPYPGYTATAIAVGPDNKTRALWTNTDGRASLWSIDANGNPSGWEYGPYPGYTARALVVGPDNRPHLLWTNTDGRASLWVVDANGNPSGWEFGPFPGWTARSISVGPDNQTHVLWTNADGRASLWNVDGNGNPTGWEFGPFSGYTATAIAVGSDNKTRVLWNNVSGEASLWSIDANGNPSGWEFGPYSGYTATSLAVGPDNRARLLWDNTDGRASLWSVGPNGTPSGWEFGPY